jgi:site-specific recombinase XerD
LLPKISNQKLNAYLKIIAAKAGIQLNLSHHVGRRTIATLLTSIGIDSRIISRILGHQSNDMIRHYAEVMPEVSQKAMKEFESLFIN